MTVASSIGLGRIKQERERNRDRDGDREKELVSVIPICFLLFGDVSDSFMFLPSLP